MTAYTATHASYYHQSIWMKTGSFYSHFAGAVYPGSTDANGVSLLKLYFFPGMGWCIGLNTSSTSVVAYDSTSVYEPDSPVGTQGWGIWSAVPLSRSI